MHITICYTTIIMLYMLSVCIIKSNFASRGNVNILLHHNYTGDSLLLQEVMLVF